jgi:transposase
MYIDYVPNRNSKPAILLRESRREGKKVSKRTLANLSNWPQDKIEAFDRLLKGEKLVSANSLLKIERSIPHGHVMAVLHTARKLGIETLLSAGTCRERDLVLAMLAERVIRPCSKLATTRLWHTTTLAEEIRVCDATEDDLYGAMDWLLARQPRIEKKLAARHLSEGCLVLYDVTSSYYEGHTCPLAQFGHDRDGKRGRPIIVFGVLCDEVGRPVAVDVYPGNTGDPTTVVDQVQKLQDRFGLQHVVVVGDRGMLTQTQIERLKSHPGLGWISALRSTAIRKLVVNNHLQMSLFDQKNLAEIRSDDFPGERLIACYNPLLAVKRRRKRDDLLAATEKELSKIAAQVARRTRNPLSKTEIAQKVGRVINRKKVAKHFTVKIDDGSFSFSRKTESILRQQNLDGIYVIRTGEPAERISAEDAVRNYKSLQQVERAFRSLKGVDLLVRPIHHRTADHVRAHIFLCMLAYYIEWQMRKDLAPVLFDDEELDQMRRTRDPVSPVRSSSKTRKKKNIRVTVGGLAVHSFQTLLAELATLCRNYMRITSDPTGEGFHQFTEPTPLQKRAFELLGCVQ